MSFFDGDWKVFHGATPYYDIKVEDDPQSPYLVKVTFKTTPLTVVPGYILTTTGAVNDPRFFFIHIEEPMTSTDVRHYVGRVTFPASYDPSRPVVGLDTIVNGRIVEVRTNASGAMVLLNDDDWTSNRPVV